MAQTLLTGASGLLAHQRKLDVVANNIANLNTTGYKSQQVLFSDLIYTDLSSGLGPSGQQGGINPRQIGNGVQVAQIAQNFSQGVFSDTGSAFDFAIEGDGFFVTNGGQEQFTRDGSFSMDSDGYLVDPSTGAYVQRTGVVGESLNGVLGFQASGDNRINVPLGASVPGSATTAASFIGNLPASATPPLAEILATSTAWASTGTPATAATLLNDLDLSTTDYQAGDTIEVVGTDVDGSSFIVSVPVDATTTVGDLTAAINGNLTGGQMTISANGNLLLTANQPGEALLSLNLSDGNSNTGEFDFDQSIFVIETDGKAADTVDSTIQVFDSRGQPHPIHVSMEKIDFNRWDATFTPADGSLALNDGSITQILFNEDGSFQTVNGTGAGDANIEISVASLTTPQEIQIDLSNLTHLATNYSATFDQDGFPPGDIVSMNVSADGTLTGVSTNGRRLEVAQLAIARFSNNQGLESVGGNNFIQSANSGQPNVGSGQADGRGSIRGGQLETSNVDVALEFTQLIVAQRGFSANARSITVATEVLQELNNIF